MSQLKKLVNDKPLWDSFCDELDLRIERVHTNMEQSDNSNMLFKLQGQTVALRSLKNLRAEVNANA
tara:strand:+ start:58 stop:255 length:198 start_codon:yes stop_codon:yes gene_type:complete